MQIKNLLFIVVVGVMVMASCTPTNSQQIKLKTAADSAAYAIGIDLGHNIKKNLPEAPGGKDLNLEIILQAFSTVMKGDSGMIPSAKAGAITQAYFMKAQSMDGLKNKEAGKKFLEENGKKKGVVTTASGLQYEILKEGNGPKPTAENTVKVHYHGTTIDGKVFDSSVNRGEPVTFGLGQVIKGWTEALQLMPVGSKWKIYIPSELGYGEQSAGPNIKPNSVLIFEVELLGIEPAAKPATPEKTGK
ncbi:MAG: FKBP-type peptidyl-prolyl cis-trans isomerase [Marinilabiliales bacterium]|nr:FKBP-type peptidyl-prolyl cis-trans isomerase [Marinilabiliales bacterium]